MEEFKKVEEALVIVLHHYSSNEDRRKAQEYLETVKNNDDICFSLSLQLIKQSGNPSHRHYGLTLLEHSVVKRWSILDPQTFCEQLISLSSDPFGEEDVPEFLLEKYAKVLVETAKRIWPQKWGNFMPFVFSLLKSSSLSQITVASRTFRCFCDEIIEDPRLPPARRSELREAINECMDDIFSSLISLLHKHHALYLQEKNEGHGRVVKECLLCLQSFLGWCPLEQFLKDEKDADRLILPLCILLHHSLPSIQTQALGCLEKIVSRKPENTSLSHALFFSLPAVAEALFDPLNPEDGVLSFQTRVFQFISELTNFGIFSPKNREALSETQLRKEKNPVNADGFFEVVMRCSGHPSCVIFGVAMEIWRKLARGTNCHLIFENEGFAIQLLVIIAVRLRKLSYNSRVKMEGDWADEHSAVWKSIEEEEVLSKGEYFTKFAAYTQCSITVLRTICKKHPLKVMEGLRELTKEVLSQPPLAQGWARSHPSFFLFEEKVNGLVRFIECAYETVTLSEDEQVARIGCEVTEIFLHSTQQFLSPPDPSSPNEVKKSRLIIASLCLTALRSFDAYFRSNSPHLIQSLNVISSFVLDSHTRNLILTKEWRSCRQKACSLLVHLARSFPSLLHEVGQELLTKTRVGVGAGTLVAVERNLILQAVVGVGRSYNNYNSYHDLLVQVLGDAVIQWETSPELGQFLGDPAVFLNICSQINFVDECSSPSSSSPTLFPAISETWPVQRVAKSLLAAFVALFQECRSPWKEEGEEKGEGPSKEFLAAGGFLLEGAAPPVKFPPVRHPFHPLLAKILPRVTQLVRTLHQLTTPFFRENTYKNASNLWFLLEYVDGAERGGEEREKTREEEVTAMRRNYPDFLRQNCYSLIQCILTSPGNQELYSDQKTIEIFSIISSTLPHMEDRHLVMAMKMIIFPYFLNCPKPLIHQRVGPLVFQFLQYMFQYSQHHWLSLPPSSPSPSPSSPTPFGTPTLVAHNHNNNNNQQQQEEIIRDKFQREAIQTFMDELNNIFKTKAGGGKGKGRGRGGGEGEVDEVKEAFEGLFPFGQYIILTPSLLGQVLRQCSTTFCIRDSPSLLKAYALTTKILDFVYFCLREGAYQGLSAEDSVLLEEFLCGHLLRSVGQAMQDHRNKSMISQLTSIFTTLLSKQISPKGDEMMVEVLMSLPHSPPRNECEKIVVFVRQNEMGSTQRKAVTTFLRGSVGIWGGGETKHVEYPPLLPLTIQKNNGKKEEEVVDGDSLSTLFQ